MNGGAPWATCRQFVQSFTNVGILSQASIEVVSIGFVLKQGKESVQALFYGAHNSHLHSCSTADLLAAHVDLDDLRVSWIELLVWEIAAEHQ